MRISCKVEYGIRALLDLALHNQSGPSLSRETASRQSIPETYLNQLLLQLRRAGLITSVRGPRGGHMLARTPDTITVLDIMEALEGPLVVVAEINNDIKSSTPSETDSLLTDVWDDLRRTMHQHLASTTLQDLVDRKQQYDGELMYEI